MSYSKVVALGACVGLGVLATAALAMPRVAMEQVKKKDTGSDDVDPEKTLKQGFKPKLVPEDLDIIVIGSGIGYSPVHLTLHGRVAAAAHFRFNCPDYHVLHLCLATACVCLRLIVLARIIMSCPRLSCPAPSFPTGGLVFASFMAQLGKTVLVLEQHDQAVLCLDPTPILLATKGDGEDHGETDCHSSPPGREPAYIRGKGLRV